MKNISCHFYSYSFFSFFLTPLLGDAEMMHKLHVLQYPGLTKHLSSDNSLSLTFAHTHSLAHTVSLSPVGRLS